MNPTRPRPPRRNRGRLDVRSIGIAILVVVGIIGVVLGARGWSVRNAGSVAGNLSAVGGTGSSSTTSTSPTSTSTTRSTSNSSGTSTTAPSTSPPKSKGPTLASAGYTPYAYEIYPAKENATTRLALAGFNYSIHPSGSSVSLNLTIAGSGQSAVKKSYPSVDKIYFIDTTLGDDSNNSDYSYGDDGLIATDASGHIVQ